MDRRSLIALAALAAASPAAASAPPSEERKRGGGPSFIQIPTVTATVIRSGARGRGVMTVETGLDVPDERLRTRATASQPRLRAAYVSVLQTYAAGLPGGAVPNADYLSREFQRQTDMVLGRAGARLLLGTILIN